MPEAPNTNAWLAALLSFLIPGVGQVFNQRLVPGIIWFCVVGIGYWLFIIPGAILQAICILCAFRGALKK